MSTSRARFRSWSLASALIVAVLCAGSVLLFSDSDTPAWDTTDATIPHQQAHAGGDGWLNTKHIIGSNEEGPVATRGCRSLLDSSVNKARTPVGSPSFSVSLDVNFRAQNCVDYYVCDTRAVGDYQYRRSTWKEDHHHRSGSIAGGLTHQDTYTIKLSGDGGVTYATHLTRVNIHADVDAGLTSACGGDDGGGGATPDPTEFTLTVAAHFTPDLAAGDVNGVPVTVTHDSMQSLDGCTETAGQQTARWGAPVTWEGLVNRPDGPGETQCRYVLQLARCPVSTHRFTRGEWHGGDTDAQPVVTDRGDDGAEVVDAYYDGRCVVDPPEFMVRVNIVIESTDPDVSVPDDARANARFALSPDRQEIPGDTGFRMNCDAALRVFGPDSQFSVPPSNVPVGEPALVISKLPRRSTSSLGGMCRYTALAPAAAKGDYRASGPDPVTFKHHRYPDVAGTTSTELRVQQIHDQPAPHGDGTETLTLVYEWTPPPDPPDPPPPVCLDGSTFEGRRGEAVPRTTEAGRHPPSPTRRTAQDDATMKRLSGSLRARQVRLNSDRLGPARVIARPRHLLTGSASRWR